MIEGEIRPQIWSKITSRFKKEPRLPGAYTYLPHSAKEILEVVEKPHNITRKDIAYYVNSGIPAVKKQVKRERLTQEACNIAISQFKALDYLYGNGSPPCI